MFGIEEKIAAAAQKAAAVTMSGILAAVGAGFLTAAFWMVLSELRSPVFAATVIGFVYVGIAALVLALGAGPRRKRHDASPSTPPFGELSPLQLIVVSFLQGLDEGRKAKR